MLDVFSGACVAAGFAVGANVATGATVITRAAGCGVAMPENTVRTPDINPPAVMDEDSRQATTTMPPMMKIGLIGLVDGIRWWGAMDSFWVTLYKIR